MDKIIVVSPLKKRSDCSSKVKSNKSNQSNHQEVRPFSGRKKRKREYSPDSADALKSASSGSLKPKKRANRSPIQILKGLDKEYEKVKPPPKKQIDVMLKKLFLKTKKYKLDDIL